MRLIATVELTSALADLAQVYPWLDAAAADLDLPEDLLTRMHVALEEAVANVAMHGFEPGVVGRISLSLREAPEGLALEVEDNGAAFDPTTAVAVGGADTLADVRIGGRGLKLIRGCCSEIGYERCGGMNRLRMRF